MSERRLPIYLLLDTSGSMEGEAIEAVKNGLDEFQDKICEDPRAEDTVFVGVIEFGGDSARYTSPLESIGSFERPELRPEGLTPMGKAFELLAETIKKEVKQKSNAEDRGDYKPIVFVYTDGHPNDGNWESKLKNFDKANVSAIIGAAAGPDAKVDCFKYVCDSEHIFRLENATDLKQFLVYASQVAIKSSKTDPAAKDDDILPPPPPDFIIAGN